jgi:hypothetical protein
MKKVYAVIVGVAITGIAMATAAYAGDAYDQLQGMSNTGVTYDGSDGARSGMDINVSPSYGTIPEVPAPTPVDTGSSYQPEPAPEPVSQPQPAPEPPREGTEVAE